MRKEHKILTKFSKYFIGDLWVGHDPKIILNRNARSRINPFYLAWKLALTIDKNTSKVKGDVYEFFYFYPKNISDVNIILKETLVKSP